MTANTTSADLSFQSQVLPLQPDLFRLALKYTRNPSDAEDLVQDTLARAIGAWDSFLPGSNCKAWLCRILTNSFITTYRKKKRHRRFFDEAPADTTSAAHGDVGQRAKADSNQLWEESLGDEVSSALEALGPGYREVVELADLKGHRYREIASQLGVPMGTVMSRLFRARRQLEEALSDYARNDYGIGLAAA